MLSTYLPRAAWLLAGLFLSFFAAAQACPAEGPYADPAKWEAYGGTTLSVVSDAAGVCDDAFRLQLAAVQPAIWDAGIELFEDQSIVDRENTVYEVSFRYRAAAPRNVQFLINSKQRGTTGSGDHTYEAPLLQAKTYYQTYRKVFTSVRQRRDRDKYSLFILLSIGDSTTDVYVDDIVIREYVPITRPPATFYVSPGGDDTNDGSSLSSAWRTLGYAFSRMVGGDELLLADGLYQENNLSLQFLDGSASRPTVVRALNQWGAKIESQAEFGSVLQVLNCNHVLIEGLEVFNDRGAAEGDWTPGIQTFGTNYVTIQDCYAHDCGCNGISAREGDYVTIQRNVARDNAKTNPYNCSGISIYQPIQLDDAPGPHIIVRQNVVFENECRLPFSPAGFDVPTDGNGIILDDFNWTQGSESAFLAEALVENNLAFNNGGAGIKIYEVANATIRNNTTYHNNYVLQEFASGTGEIGAQAITGTLNIDNNITVNPEGQNSYALSYESFGRRGGTVTATSNLLVGRVLAAGTLGQTDNDTVDETQQAYPRFLQATVTPPASFTSVADFAPYFGLAFGSPALNTASAALAPATDLAGGPRPQDGGVDKGAFEGGGTPPPPTCDDGIQNGDETGVDCGGASCPACPTGPTCTDGLQNGNETGVDCGGPDCPACPTPVQDLPGTVQVEAYARAAGTITTASSGDTDGTDAIFFGSKNASVDIPVNVTQAGTYAITYRVKLTAAANIYLYVDGQFVQRTRVRAGLTTGNWQDITTTADFPLTGTQSFNIRVAEAGVATMNHFSGQFSGGGNRVARKVSGTAAPTRLTVFPNPTDAVLAVRLPADTRTVRLLDPHGRILREQAAGGRTRLDWPVTDLPAGLYVVSATATDGQRQIQRVVIR